MADIVRLEENGVAKYIQTHERAIVGLDEKLAKSGKTIFKGAVYFMESQKYSFDINDIKESIVLAFCRYEPGNGSLGYGHYLEVIPKADIAKREGRLRVILLGLGGTPAFKKFYVSTSAVWGEDDNAADGNQNWCLEEVYLN